MKYIIMCGTNTNGFTEPRQLYKVGGESIVARTIRLLRKNGITDIAISTNLKGFEHFNVPILHHENTGTPDYTWLNCFYPTYEETCYLMGDVVFSEECIKTIVNTFTDDVEMFGSAPPFDNQYYKPWAEPFAFKVVNVNHFWKAIAETKKLWEKGKFKRRPLAWELWQVIKGTPLNRIDYSNYTVINDYTCDIDNPSDLYAVQKIIIG